MQDHPVLGQLALGYSPMIDRERMVVATRLTIFPERPDALADVPALLGLLEEVWPRLLGPEDGPGAPRAEAASASSALPRGGLALNIAGEALLQAVMQVGPGAGRLLEIPTFMAAQPGQVPVLQALHAQGALLLLKGRPLAPLSPEALSCFSFSVVELEEDRRGGQAGPPGVRKVHSVYGGIRSTRDADTAFERGAVAVLGWPHEDPAPVAVGKGALKSDVSVVMELIQGVDSEQPVPRLEAILKRDPALAFRLMRYLNSPAFGLSVEITSFGHALMLLGHARLKRWLVLLLASASKDAKMRPLQHAAVRRGLFMEELVRSQGDREMAGELFICGVFSLLDRLLQQPFEHLLAGVPVPERVQQALLSDGGPYQPYLELARAVEAESVFDIREMTEQLFLSPSDVNRALLKALHVARSLD